MIFTKTRQVKSPTRGTTFSAGLDFYVPDDYLEFSIEPGESVTLPSGIKIVLDDGTAGVFFNKSSVGSRGVILGACVVDADYRGEIQLNLHNISNSAVTFLPGQKIVQMLIIPVALAQPNWVDTEQYEKHQNTTRGSGGFGSTGIV